MTKPHTPKAHKNAEFIKAYADGKDVQWLSDSGEWNDLVTDDAHLLFYSSNLRIKPEQPWYRVALCKYGIEHTAFIVDSERGEQMWQQDAYFVRWLTERVPYDI